jgi:hypothetical protein
MYTYITFIYIYLYYIRYEKVNGGREVHGSGVR